MAPSSKRRKLSDDKFEAVTREVSTDGKEQEQRRSLFVRSLPASVTTDRLIEHFSQSYPLKHATVVVDPATKLSRGFGFVTFTDAEDAQAAQAEFDRSELDGRKIRVEVAEARHREVAGEAAGEKQSINIKAEELRAKRQQEIKDNQPPKLIVRNLPWSIKTAADLSKLFLSYGRVKHAVVPKLPSNKHAQAGFGIVILRGKKNAERALAGLNGKEVDGRTLAVDWAVDKDTWAKAKQEDLAKEEAGVSAKEVSNDEHENDQTQDVDGVDVLPDLDEDDDEDADEDDSGNDMDEAEDELEDDDTGDDNVDEAMSTAQTQFNTENTTIFIRNLPFSATDETLSAHFKDNFGPVRYARVVYDAETGQSRGTAFVCLRHEADAKSCVKDAPKPRSSLADTKQNQHSKQKSILQDEREDPTGKYTLDGRVLQITRALPKDEADRRASESAKDREKKVNDKRRLYLLAEGTIARGSKLWNSLGKSELDIRESSAKQRQKLIKTNPNLGLSLTRLSIRNLPRFVDGKQLKQLAREAVVGFATDVREGKRQPVSKEELARAGEADRENEMRRRQEGKGLVKQAKVVYESDMTGGKVAEGKGGRSRGYGFIEYHGHRNALMALRWLNGHVVKGKGDEGQEKNKRLIVEFAIENAQVVQRRSEREQRVKDRREKEEVAAAAESKKRKSAEDEKSAAKVDKPEDQEEKNKVAMRNRIIAQKRQKRKARRG